MWPGVQNAMLVKMPRGPVEYRRENAGEACDSFEAALRRDLASTPVVAYEPILGGVAKRLFDLAITVAAAPLWLTVLLCAALWARLRHRTRVFYADERIGYGGRSFRCLRLQIQPPVAEIALLHPDAAGSASLAMALRAERGSRRRRALERLPQLLNVLHGDMSLVGPEPLDPEGLDPLKTAKRYYLSARPGFVGVSALAAAGDKTGAEFKVYSLCWSLGVDATLLLNALAKLWGGHQASPVVLAENAEPSPGLNRRPG